VHWLVTDETNRTPAEGDFFIYGGLVLSSDQVAQLHKEIEAIRTRHGFEPTDDFKFNSRSRPSQVSAAEALEAKSEALAAAKNAGARMIAYVIHHGIAAGAGDKDMVRYAINSVISAYHRLLTMENEVGIVLIDRMDEKYAYQHLKQLFQQGLLLNSGSTVGLSGRIIQYGMSSNNTSHISSLVDIALGAFRYCVNTAGGRGNDAVAQRMFPTLAELMWGQDANGVKRVGGMGYIARPMEIRAPSYKAQYDGLAERLTAFAADPTDSGEPGQEPAGAS